MHVNNYTRPCFIAVLLMALLAGCSRERGDIPKGALPEFYGVSAYESGRDAQPLNDASGASGHDFGEEVVFIVYQQGISAIGVESQVKLFDRAVVRHEVEHVKARRDGPTLFTRLQPAQDPFASFTEIPLRFRPAAKPDMLVAVPAEPLKPGIYLLRAGQASYHFSIGLGSTAPAESAAVRKVDHYFVTLDAKAGSSIEALFALSKRGLAIGGNRNSIGGNAILEDFYRDTSSLDQEMASRRDAALAALKSGDFANAVSAALEARGFFPDNSDLVAVLQEAPEAAVRSAMDQKRWEEANGWITRGREIAPDRQKFEEFAKDAAFTCAMNEAEENFSSGKFQAAAEVAERAAGIAPGDEKRKEAEQFARKAKVEQHLAASREAREKKDVDAQFDAAVAVLDLDPASSEARKLATEAREKMLSDEHYFGKYFQVTRRIDLKDNRLWEFAFTEDGRRLHAYFDSSPRLLVAWDAESGEELERHELSDNFNIEAAPGMLASLINPKRVKQSGATMMSRRELSSAELRLVRLTNGEPVCTIDLGEGVALGEIFLTRSDRLMAAALNKPEGSLLLVDPARGTALHTLSLPFTSELDARASQYGDQRLRIKQVAFSSDRAFVAASNGYGIGVFRVADGQLVHSVKSDDVRGLLGLSRDGERIALSPDGMMMVGGTWHLWNLSDGSKAKQVQGVRGYWRFTPDLELGFVENNGKLCVIAAEKDEPLAELPPPKGDNARGFFDLRGLKWDRSPDGRRIAIAANDAIEVWSLRPPPLPE